MKKSYILHFVCLATFVFGLQNARAEFLIEPFAGYAAHDFDDEKSTGAMYGGRIGWGMFGVTIGAQYEGGSTTTKCDDNAGTISDCDATGSSLGAFVNVNLPIWIRFWATSFFSSEATIKDATVDPDGVGGVAAVTGKVELEGKGFEVGIGFTGIPFLNINLSMTTLTYDEIHHPVEDVATVDFEDSKDKIIMLSLSVPISF